MGGSALALIPVLIIVAIALWLLFSGVVFAGAGHAGRDGKVVRPDPGRELRYQVPEGQDPVVVLTALHLKGYDAVLEEPEGRRIIDVSCPEDKDHDREEVRHVIAAAGTTLDAKDRVDVAQPVRFLDEQAA